MGETQLVRNVEPHSVEISQNAKGELAFSVKVYAANPRAAADQALAIAQDVRNQVAAMKGACP